MKWLVTLIALMGVAFSQNIKKGTFNNGEAGGVVIVCGPIVVSGSTAFPATIVGSTSAVNTFTVTNNASTSVALGPETVSANFAIQANSCTDSLNGGASCSFGVAFTPSTAGTIAGTLQIANGCPSSPIVLSLSGTATAPIIQANISPSNLTFPDTTVGTSSSPGTITVTNGGNASLSLSGISIVGSSAGSFSQTNNCSGSLAVAASCTINVTFAPTTTGTVSAVVQISDSDPTSPQTVGVSGNGVGTAACVLNPSSVNFGTQAIGTTTSAQTVTCTNTGTLSLQVSSVSVTGTNAGDFSADGSACTSAGPGVPPGGSCNIRVTFTPSLAGAEAAILNVASNSTTSPDRGNLAGTGQATVPALNIGAGTATGRYLKIVSTSAYCYSSGCTASAGPLAFAPLITNGAQTTAAEFSVLNNNAAVISKTGWVMNTADSAVPTGCDSQDSTHTCALAIDGSSGTYWVTQYKTTQPPQPHTFEIDMGSTSTISGFQYLPRQDGCVDGTILGYQFYVSTDGHTWGSPILNTAFSYSDISSLLCPGESPTPTVRNQFISASSLTFSSQNVATTSPSQTITIQNTGNATDTISSITATGDFGVSNTCGGSLAAGTSCNINVTFTPTASGLRLGTVKIADSTPIANYAIGLTGTGVAACTETSITVSPATPILIPGQTQQFTATNNCGSNITSCVTWSSAKTSVVTMSGSVATAVQPGTSVVSATDSSTSSNCTNTAVAGNTTVSVANAITNAFNGMGVGQVGTVNNYSNANSSPAITADQNVFSLGVTASKVGRVRMWDTFPFTRWQDIQTGAATFSFTNLDAWLSSSLTNGYEMDYVFSGCPIITFTDGAHCTATNQFPTDVFTGDGSVINAITTFLNHKYDGIHTYGCAGTQTTGCIRIWEVWNEPNSTNFLNYSFTSLMAQGGVMAQYEQVVADVCNAIHSFNGGNNRMICLAGGVQGFSGTLGTVSTCFASGTSCSPAQFLQAMYCDPNTSTGNGVTCPKFPDGTIHFPTGMNGLVDGFNMHGYNSGNSPAKFWPEFVAYKHLASSNPIVLPLGSGQAATLPFYDTEGSFLNSCTPNTGVVNGALSGITNDFGGWMAQWYLLHAALGVTSTFEYQYDHSSNGPLYFPVGHPPTCSQTANVTAAGKAYAQVMSWLVGTTVANLTCTSTSSPTNAADCDPTVISNIPRGMMTLDLQRAGTLVSTTSYATETGNNTAACTTQSYCAAPFAGLGTNGADTGSQTTKPDSAPGNVSTVDIHTLVPTGTKVFAHFMGWFTTGTGTSHTQTHYNSNSANTVNAQMNDMIARHYDGLIIDWYSSLNATVDGATLKIRANLNPRCLSNQNCPLLFAIQEDQGAIFSANYHNCPSTDTTTTGCVVQAFETDLCYMNQNYLGAASYLRINPTTFAFSSTGSPVVQFFPPSGNLNANQISVIRTYATNLSGNCPAGNGGGINNGPVILVSENSGAFATYGGAFNWISPLTWNATTSCQAPNANNALQVGTQFCWNGSAGTYLDNFYSTAASNPTEPAWGSAFAGFDDNNANWGTNRVIAQRCGLTWLNSFAKTSLATNLKFLHTVTWNDYEEGTELETGIATCYGLPTISLSGTTVSWTVGTGDTLYAPLSPTNGTIHHFTVYYGQNGGPLAVAADNLSPTTRSFDLGTVKIPPGQWIVYVKLVSQPGMQNVMSTGAAYNVWTTGRVVWNNNGSTTGSNATYSVPAQFVGKTGRKLDGTTFTIPSSQAVGSDPVLLTTSGLTTDCTLWVSPLGGGSGTTATTPETIAQANTNGNAGSVVAGSHVCMKAGLYARSDVIDLLTGGTVGSHVVWEAYQDGPVVIQYCNTSSACGSPSSGNHNIWQITDTWPSSTKNYIDFKWFGMLIIDGGGYATNGFLFQGVHHITITGSGSICRNLLRACVATGGGPTLATDYIQIVSMVATYNGLNPNAVGYTVGCTSAFSINQMQKLTDGYTGIRNVIAYNYVVGEADLACHTDGNGIILDLSSVTSTPPTLIAANLIWAVGGRCIEINTSGANIVTNTYVVFNTCYKDGLDKTMLSAPANFADFHSNNAWWIDNISQVWGGWANQYNYQQDGSPTPTGQTFRADAYNGGAGNDFSDTNLIAEDVKFNSPPVCDPTADLQYKSGSTCAVSPFTLGTGLSLQASSPALNQGVDPVTVTGVTGQVATDMAAWVYKDITGVSRPQGNGFTLGAYEVAH